MKNLKKLTTGGLIIALLVALLHSAPKIARKFTDDAQDVAGYWWKKSEYIAEKQPIVDLEELMSGWKQNRDLHMPLIRGANRVIDNSTNEDDNCSEQKTRGSGTEFDSCVPSDFSRYLPDDKDLQ